MLGGCGGRRRSIYKMRQSRLSSQMVWPKRLRAVGVNVCLVRLAGQGVEWGRNFPSIVHCNSVGGRRAVVSPLSIVCSR